MLSPLQRLSAAVLFLGVVAAGFLFAWFNDGLVRFDYVAGAVETRFAFVVFGALAVTAPKWSHVPLLSLFSSRFSLP